jgi:hypothetical protein
VCYVGKLLLFHCVLNMNPNLFLHPLCLPNPNPPSSPALSPQSSSIHPNPNSSPTPIRRNTFLVHGARSVQPISHASCGLRRLLHANGHDRGFLARDWVPLSHYRRPSHTIAMKGLRCQGWHGYLANSTSASMMPRINVL